MYKAFFGLTENPFSLTPDPRCFYLSRYHEESLAHLMYSLTGGGGFVMLTGEVGTGKTTLCRYLLERLPEGVDVALILNPKQSVTELLANMCDELGIDYKSLQNPTLKTYVDLLNDCLLENHAAGRRTVLVIDEAQALSVDVLEQVRLLTNLETAKSKLLHIILIGQPELKVFLARSDLRQLDQRISARCHIEPLSRAETEHYIRHRMNVAGQPVSPFNRWALRLIHQASGGIPRVINKICDRALLGAYAEDRPIVTSSIVKKSISEVTDRRPGSSPIRTARRYALPALAALALILLAALVLQARPFSAAIFGERSSAIADARREKPAAPVPLKKPADPPVRQPEARIRTADGLRAFFDNPHPLADREAALRRLALMWDKNYTDDGAPVCVRARSYGLDCYTAKGSWDELRRFSLCAAIKLAGPRGARHAVVTYIDENRIELSASEPAGIFGAVDVSPFWDGEFTVVWKRPPGLISNLIENGSRGRDVLWLREKLDAIMGRRQAEGEPELFDRALDARVRAFQRSRSVKADGLVGPVTLILLTTASAETPAPLLKKNTGGG
jgi:general secretion pathway protein A